MHLEVHKSVISVSETVRANYFETVEATLHIQNHGQFVKWTQSELQEIFPHGRFLCGVGRRTISGEHILRVVAHNHTREHLQRLQRADGSVCCPIFSEWMKVKHPILFESDSKVDVSTIPSELADYYRGSALINSAAHGLYDTSSRTASYFCFSNIPISLNLHHAYILRLLVPHMHAALIRVVPNTKFKKRSSSQPHQTLTPREKEILQWLATGK